MHRLFKGLVAVVFGLSLCLCGCSTNKAPQDDNSVVLAMDIEPPQGFDPIVTTHYAGLFQSALLKRDMDLNLVGDLAESYDVSDDGRTIDVTLKDNLKFSDGSPLRPLDVVFTFNEAKNNPASSTDLSELENIQATEDNHVVFTLSQPNIFFVDKLAGLGIVPEASYGQDYGTNPIGSGPLKLIQWKPGEQLICEPNPYYYGSKINYDKVVILFTNPDAAGVLAKSQSADVIRIPCEMSAESFEGYHLVSLKTCDNRGIALPYLPDTGKTTDDSCLVSGAPLGNKVTSDKAIRKALNIAIDRQALIEGALLGQGSPAYSICDGMPWNNSQANLDEDGNVALANKILDEAGWKTSADGIREKQGVKASFELWFAYKDRENLALAFCDTAKKIGLEVTPHYADWSEVEKHMYSQAVLFGWGGYNPVDVYYNYSSTTKGYEYYNSNFYGNKDVDAHLEKAKHSLSMKEAEHELKLAQWDGSQGFSSKGDCPWVWLVNENHCYLVRDGLDIGKQKIQPHAGGWPVIETISSWKRTND